ncbi:hypothetical protein Taro_009569 [Colocasia esculenta]|uniref:Uncharacterized protein n=1 Tax=Colocasia esculenta TaxID=4460 RepID=A0A843U625_COLES|nr:hypothetical protein [Colocasia esculenta]
MLAASYIVVNLIDGYPHAVKFIRLQQCADLPFYKLIFEIFRMRIYGADVSTSSEEIDMASRGRRGVPTRDGEQKRDEPRREDQGEQQAPAPQGPVLPPPPPVDYGVFMQGLVQVMQTQAHTQAALQAQLEAQVRIIR